MSGKALRPMRRACFLQLVAEIRGDLAQPTGIAAEAVVVGHHEIMIPLLAAALIDTV